MSGFLYPIYTFSETVGVCVECSNVRIYKDFIIESYITWPFVKFLNSCA